MASAMLQMLLLACLLPASLARGGLLVTPESPVLEIGSNFTATCVIVDAEDLTAEDLYWNLSKSTVPEEHYTKINRTAVSVTIAVTGEKTEWLYCHGRRVSHQGRDGLTHGIVLKKAYPPGRPGNVSCEALQEESSRVSSLSCWWDPSGRQAAEAPTTYTLMVDVKPDHEGSVYAVETRKTRTSLELKVYPFHMTLDVWVRAHNSLGAAESEHLQEDASCFVKTKPPSNVNLISEKSFPTSLLSHWEHPIYEVYMKLIYQIRFCAKADAGWTYVPPADTSKYIESFRLQKLRADTLYTVQVRCKNAHCGPYWSDWSSNVTKRTPEDKPTSKPNVWTIVGNAEDQRLQVVAKDPKFSNGRTRRFELKLELLEESLRNGSAAWERIPVHKTAPHGGPGRHVLKQLPLPLSSPVNVSVAAVNSVGTSPVAWLIVADKTHDLPPVEDLAVRPAGGQLEVRWRPSRTRTASEFVVEWSSEGGPPDWQREGRGTTNTTVRGRLDSFVCYNVSVYPIYSGWRGKARSTQAFLEQGAPLDGPSVAVRDKPGYSEAELVWTQIPPHRRRGFITNYTIFYSCGSRLYNVTVPANATSYTLRSLSGNTKYDAWMVASTIRGSTRGYNHSFTTQKYAPGQMEAIVVGTCILFFFLVLMAALLCIYKEDMIKRSLWPRIPNPEESTIGSWSPDAPLKVEAAKAGGVSGVSVLAVEVCDVHCALEDDKSSLALKRDKYLSEEHSSGIGGSSCMSSPRHSVSDSDEGGDGADTTASTVQYSSVVPVGGYKGQTPSFSRSESTQPLLDPEEPPEAGVHGGRRAPADGGGQPQAGALDFEPIAEEAESQAAESRCSYRPQRSGYRPQ